MDFGEGFCTTRDGADRIESRSFLGVGHSISDVRFSPDCFRFTPNSVAKLAVDGFCDVRLYKPRWHETLACQEAGIVISLFR